MGVPEPKKKIPKFRATLRVSDLDGPDPAAVQRTLEERLKQAGLERWRILKIEAVEAVARRGSKPDKSAVPAARTAGNTAHPGSPAGLLLVGAGAVAIWFFWYISGTSAGGF